jgi:hypothetical protein
MVRAGTVGTHPAIIRMIAGMVEEQPSACPEGCCAARGAGIRAGKLV